MSESAVKNSLDFLTALWFYRLGKSHFRFRNGFGYA